MPKMKEFTVTIEDKPGALGKCLLALAERGVNVLAFQSYVEEGESLARILVDDPASAKVELGRLRMIFEETEVALVRLAHKPGELGRAAARLGEKQINIDYSYCGLEPGSTRALVVFGVDNSDQSREPAGRTGQPETRNKPVAAFYPRPINGIVVAINVMN